MTNILTSTLPTNRSAFLGLLEWLSSEESTPMQETLVQSLGTGDLLEESMATYSSILAWRMPWTEQPAGYNPWGRMESDRTETSEPNRLFLLPLSHCRQRAHYQSTIH